RRMWEGPGLAALREVVGQMGISIFGTPLDGIVQEAEYRRVFAAMSQDRLGALIVDDAAENLANGRVIVELAAKARLPTMYPRRAPVELGGLMAYGPDVTEINRGAALQIDRIFRGAKPQDMPFYQVLKFELILNLKTARDLGLTFPQSLVPDGVIE